MNKLIALLLALTVLLLAGCESKPDIDGADSVTDTETSESAADYLSQFTLVRGDTCSDAMTAASVELRKLIEGGLGLKLNIETDWTKRGGEITRYGREILIGSTNRDESKAAIDEFTNSPEPLDYYISSSGDHYVIVADDSYISEAVRLFYDTVISNTEENIMLTREHDFPCEDFAICGVAINEFTSISYPEAYNAYQKADIDIAADIIYRATGKRLNVGGSADGHSIILGGFDALAGLDYKVEFTDGSLHLGGSNYYADIRALYNVLLYGALGYSCEGDFEGTHPLEQADIAGETLSFKTQPDVILSAWMTSGDTVEKEIQIKEAAQANFNLVNLAMPSDKQMCHNMLKWCAIYDLCILWTDGAVYGNMTSTDYSETAFYIDAPHVWGNYLVDEPNSSRFAEIAEGYRRYRENTGKEAFVNLFPNYANEQQLGNPTYQEHVDQFMETVNPDVVSVDIYPCNTSGLYDGYMRNIDVVATAARKADKLLSIYIQSVSFNAGKRIPSKTDIEWQIWCCMSFGAKSIIYFTYMTPYSTAENFLPALIDHELQKTDRWYAAQSVNAEINAVAPVFASYTNLGAFSHKCTGSTAFLKFDNQYSFDAIGEVKCDNPLLFGCFEKDGKYAFSCVNMTDLQKSGGISEVSVKTDAAVTIWQNGVSTVIQPDADGYVSFTLDVGEGVFCELA